MRIGEPPCKNRDLELDCEGISGDLLPSKVPEGADQPPLACRVEIHCCGEAGTAVADSHFGDVLSRPVEKSWGLGSEVSLNSTIHIGDISSITGCQSHKVSQRNTARHYVERSLNSHGKSCYIRDGQLQQLVGILPRD